MTILKQENQFWEFWGVEITVHKTLGKIKGDTRGYLIDFILRGI